jgi:hypothetical protein
MPGFYPPNWFDIFIPYVAFGIHAQAVGLNGGEFLAGKMINAGISNAVAFRERKSKPL